MKGSYGIQIVCLLTAVLVVDMAAVDMGSQVQTEACPSIYNPTDELKFVNPRPDHLEVFPPSDVACFEGRLQMFRCCGTGFKAIKWYFNGELISASDERFLTTDMGQAIRWFRPGPAGFNQISCELVHNETTSLRHDMKVQVIANCPVLKPYYKIQPEDKCANVGDNVTFQCEVFFGDNGCLHPIFKDVSFYDSSNNFVSQNYDGYRNVVIQSKKADDKATSVYASLTFYNVTEQQLNTKYFCIPVRHDYMKVGFKFLGPCRDNIKYTTTRATDSKLATQIAIPILLVTLIAMLIGGMIYVYRDQLRILCRRQKGPYKYDAYIICSKNESDQNFLVNNLMKELEQYYRLCIPDRDFPIGSVMPVEITEYIKESKSVVAITSTSLLQTDYCDLSLEVAIANNIPITFVKPTAEEDPLEKEKFNKLISERPKLSAALSVSKVLRYPQKADESSLAAFYNSLYNAMPLAQRVKQTEVQDQGNDEKFS